MAAFEGEAYCTTGNLTGDRYFKLSVDNTDTGPANRAGYELDAGSSVTLYFRTWTSGTLPPALPDGDGTDNVRLSVYYETGTGTLIRQLYSAGTAPATGTSYTFYATDTGLVGGNPIAGVLRLRVEVSQTNELLDNYSLNSDDDNADERPGGLVSRMLVSDLTVSAYPAGSTFAYGTAGDEIITVTATHTRRPADRNIETFQIDALDVAATQSSGSTKEIGTTTTTQTFTANNTFDDASKSYGMKFTVVGNSLLFPAKKWTVPVANGANVTQSGVNAVERQSFYTVDPRISIQNTVLSKSLHNRGFATTLDFNVQNARLENLTRSINYQLKDSGGTVKKSGSDTGSNYDIDYTIGSTDDATFTLGSGAQWTFNTNQSDVDTNPSDNAYQVSRKLMLGSAAGLNDLAVTSDKEKYMRGYVPSISYYLSEADGTALASKSVNTRVHDDGAPSNEEDLQVVASTAGGLVSYSYTISDSDKSTFDLTGSPKHVEADWSGNTSDDSADEWAVSRQLRVANYTDADNAGDYWTGKTDLDATNDYDPDGTDETDFFVGADVAYGKVRIIDVNGDNYDGAAISMWLLRNAAIAQGPQTGAFTDSSKQGWQDLFYTFDVKAPAGARVFRVEATKDGNTTGNATDTPYITKNVNYAPSYTGNLYAEINYEMHDLTEDTLRFTLTPVIYATNNDRQLLSTVSPVPTVDIDPQYHITLSESSGVPTYGGTQTSMTRITPGDDDHFETTISGLSTYEGRTVWVHIVLTLNGGQLQAGFPVVVGKYNPGKVKTKFNPLGEIFS